ncbi:uncharacterized protein BO80DRAFT_161563 [Aspergillus ibericus CBS 121593]|uniref:Transmembrane protein n=1 Tax=Aspergillus ibericus CBS 121593 TaxID=1448316 RepID=A0A395GS27_9EURO|nr:hypothetical protein BO80DRAFT_161563 [Aspergillus ibericus CBS 121593]RAK98380.1 hypothetical protein BO80DRAFT_161563 [Aspergillus ibericus CBS 121593]
MRMGPKPQLKGKGRREEPGRRRGGSGGPWKKVWIGVDCWPTGTTGGPRFTHTRRPDQQSQSRALPRWLAVDALGGRRSRPKGPSPAHHESPPTRLPGRSYPARAATYQTSLGGVQEATQRRRWIKPPPPQKKEEKEKCHGRRGVPLFVLSRFFFFLFLSFLFFWNGRRKSKVENRAKEEKGGERKTEPRRKRIPLRENGRRQTF